MIRRKQTLFYIIGIAVAFFVIGIIVFALRQKGRQNPVNDNTSELQITEENTVIDTEDKEAGNNLYEDYESVNKYSELQELINQIRVETN